MPHPGWVCDAAWESSVSSACASMPLASAATSTLVTMSVPTTVASGTADRLRAYCTAFRPGRSLVPDTMAASVSSRWCFVFSATASGNARRRAPAMYSARRQTTGVTLDSAMPHLPFLEHLLLRAQLRVLSSARKHVGTKLQLRPPLATLSARGARHHPLTACTR